MDKRIFVAGATGFVGSAVVNELLSSGYGVTALGRSAKNELFEDNENLEIIPGSALEPSSYQEAMSRCDAVINCIGIIREKLSRGITFERIHIEANQMLLKSVKAADIERYLLVSALGVRPDGITRYQTTKHTAEMDTVNSGLDYTIFRPSFIIGPGTGFVSQIAPIVRAPIVPIFGDGTYSFQPVDRRVLARCIVQAIEHPSAENVLFELRGEREWSYVEILEEIGKAMGRKRIRKVHLPLWLVKPMVGAFGWLPFSPISLDQLKMLVEGNVGTGRNAPEELGVGWIELPESLRYTFDQM